jgi:alanyl-tRNA synthetase
MEQQRSRARASWKGGEGTAIAAAYQKLREQHPTRFEGYGNTSLDESKIVGLLVDQQLVDEIPEGAEAELVLDRTPFYAEAGGQVGDQGTLLKGKDVVAQVKDVVAPLRGLSVHRITAKAPLKVGDTVAGRVSSELRDATMRNHTATHLMHAALRRTLGKHVKQAGSVVAPDRLRFDITHYTAMDQAEIEEVERLVNEQILHNIPVVTDVMDLNDAVKTGAMALFGEKYGDRVRVVQIDGFSKELCGGTHVNRTGDIGVFKITAESSISAGVRRLEAVTGGAAYEQYRDAIGRIQRLSSILHVAEPELVESVEKLTADRRNLEKEIERLKGKLAQSNVGDLVEQARVVKGIKVIAAKVDNLDRAQMRTMADMLRNKLQSGVVVLGSTENGRVALIAAVTKDLAGKTIHAGKLVGALAEAVGGKGGGRPDLAEAGGKNGDAVLAALDSVYEVVEKMA